jgi:hypothetical protein
MKASANRLCRSLAAATCCHMVLLIVGLDAATLAQPVEAWRRTIGTPAANDSFGSIAFDGNSNIYVYGATNSGLAGPNIGNQDAFIAKYDAAGNQAWIRQFGSTAFDNSSGISADALGNVYATGSTQGTFARPVIGNSDPYIVKYNAAGSQQWVRQFGTTGLDTFYAVSVDGLGNAYVGGWTGSLGGSRDAIIVKYDSTGNQIWLKQAGSPEDDLALGISAREQTNVYLVGFVAPEFNSGIDSQDYFLTKYDSSGSVVWNRQLGTSLSDQAYSVVPDGLGNIYVSGATSGLLGATQYGASDAFVSKFNTAGDLLWTRQLGTSQRDSAQKVVVDHLGNIFVVGDIVSPPAGTVSEIDPIVTKLDPNGNVIWNYQITGIQLEAISDAAIDNAGAVYLAGYTESSVTGPSDALLIKIVDIPEPSTAILGFLMTAAFAQLRSRRV